MIILAGCRIVHFPRSPYCSLRCCCTRRIIIYTELLALIKVKSVDACAILKNCLALLLLYVCRSRNRLALVGLTFTGRASWHAFVVNFLSSGEMLHSLVGLVQVFCSEQFFGGEELNVFILYRLKIIIVNWFRMRSR